MKNPPFFSVVVPTFNRAQFIGITLNSVLTQTFTDFELLVIDDGSTDDTGSIVRQYQDSRLQYIYQDNRGPSSARNTGVANARGKFIAFLDSDDRYRMDKLLQTHKYIKQNPQYKVFHTEEVWYRNGQFLAQKIYHKKPTGYIFENSTKLCSIGMSTCAIQRTVFAEVGPFDENLPACEDYDFFLRLTSRYPVFLIPHYLTIKEGGHPDQLSKKYPLMDTFRIQALAHIIESKVLSPSDRAVALRALQSKCAIVINGALKRGKTTHAQRYKELLWRIEKAYG